MLRVLTRLADADAQLCGGIYLKNLLRGQAHRNDDRRDDVLRMAVPIAPAATVCPAPARFRALREQGFHTRVERDDVATISLEALLQASGWDRYAEVLEDLVAAERDVVCAEYGAATVQLTLI